jgi:hypothetical protein
MLEGIEDTQAAMDSTALYYALSTIAQVAAALSTLIGFLGMWRLDRLKQGQESAERGLRGLLLDVHLNASTIAAQIRRDGSVGLPPRIDKLPDFRALASRRRPGTGCCRGLLAGGVREGSRQHDRRAAGYNT